MIQGSSPISPLNIHNSPLTTTATTSTTNSAPTKTRGRKIKIEPSSSSSTTSTIINEPTNMINHNPHPEDQELNQLIM